MNIGRHLLTPAWWSSFIDRRIRSRWNPHLDYHPNWMKRWILNVTNDCNLRCYSCSALCDRPWGTPGFHDRPRQTDLEYVELWLDKLAEFQPEYWVRLTGGEPTLAGPEYLEECAEIVHRHQRNCSLLTNGARFLECDPWWFEQITFDNHVVNQPHIDRCIEYLEREGYPSSQWKVSTNTVHRDLEAQRADHITDGWHCKDMMANLSLWRNVVYPCCVIYYLDGWEETNEIRDSLIAAGWHVYNPDLLEVVRDWRNTLPKEALYHCVTSCWKNGPVKEYHPVTYDPAIARIKQTHGYPVMVKEYAEDK